MNFSGYPVFPFVLPDNVVFSTGVAVVDDEVPQYSGTTGELIESSGQKMADKLNVSGTLPMTGDLDMNTHNIKNTDDVYPSSTSASDLGIVGKRYRSVYTDAIVGPVVTSGLVSPLVDNTDDLGSSTKRYKSAYVYANLTGPTNTRTVDNIVSNAAGSTAGHVATFADTSGKVITDGGSPNLGDVVGPASAVNNNVAVFDSTTGKLIKDGGAALSAYLPLAGGTMSGDLNMGTHEVNNVAAIRPSINSVIYGTSAAATGTSDNDVVVGRLATATNSSDSVIIGYSAANGGGRYCTNVGQTAITGTGDSNTAVGSGTSVTGSAHESTCVGAAAGSSGSDSTSVGFTATSTQSNCVVVGANSSATAAAAHCFGNSLTNSTAGSLLIAASADIRANTTTCDLGTTALPFQTLHLNGSVSGATNTRTADNIVSCVGASTDLNVALMSGTTGKVIIDAGATVVGSALTGYSSVQGTLSSADTVVGGISKLNGNITQAVSNAANGISGVGSFFLGASATTLYTDGSSGLVLSWDSTNKQITFTFTATTWLGGCTSIGIMGRYNQGTTTTNSSAIFATFAASTTYYLSSNSGVGTRSAGMDMASANAIAYQARLYPVGTSFAPGIYYLAIDLVADGSSAHCFLNVSRRSIS
jgi:hypothetical protein